MPDLLTPGIKDSICRKPITRAVLIVKFFSNFFSNLHLSLRYNSNPNISVVQPITFTLLRLSIAPVLTKKSPAIITGNDETIILMNNCMFLKKSCKSLRK